MVQHRRPPQSHHQWRNSRVRHSHLVQYFENLLHPSKILCREVSVKEEAREPNLTSFIRKQIRVHPWLIPLEISGELRQNAGMRRMTQVAATLYVFVLWAPVGYACYCSKSEVREAYDRAKVVFVGEVLNVSEPRVKFANAKFEDSAHTIRFKVETAWKEPFWTELNVLARVDSCFGLPRMPQKGEKYLVYAEPLVPKDPSSTQLRTDSCLTRTAPLSEISPVAGIYYANQAADDIRLLNNFMIMLAPPSRPIFNPLRVQ